MYGNTEFKSKNSHSQFVIETKNYKLLSADSYKINFVQLKRYIKFNESKIRLIALTDFNKLYVYNATEIKKSSLMNLNNIDIVNKTELKVFEQNLLININFESMDENSIDSLRMLSYRKVFGDQKFINPADYEATNSIADPAVRKNFILVLYHLMLKLQQEIFPPFEIKIIDIESRIIPGKTTRKQLNKLLTENENLPLRNYFLWGFEMNYLPNFFLEDKNFNLTTIMNFIDDRRKKDAFVLTSVYNLINKTMFLRILEDTSTKNTKFVEGIQNGRYISNGILEKKRKEGNKGLIQYFIDVFNFSQEDLRPYVFLLNKDIYNWILDLSEYYTEYYLSELLVELIRLFNDTNFKKTNQDILGDVYEHYLEQGEDGESGKKYRRLLGQYYTPKPIVRLMWYLIRDVLKKNDGRDLYDDDLPYLSILDPACGSGTFLVEAVLQINESASNKKITKDGKVFSLIRDRDKQKKIEKSLFGFELNPLSKSIADINLFFSLIQAYGEYTKNESINLLNILRTDSLDFDFDNSIQNNDDLIMFLQDEIRNSYQQNISVVHAKNSKFNIVVGNPPYGHITPNELMKKKLLPFAFSENNYDENSANKDFSWKESDFSGIAPDSEKNIGKLNDLYAYFFGTADHLCEEGGIIGYITSNTYLTIPTYKWFRKYILQNYQIEYIVNFNKVSEQSNSMFFPDAGIATAIMIMSKKKPSLEHKIKILDLSDIGSIKDKYESFCSITWGKKEGKLNKNDIINFLIKDIETLDFKSIKQNNFLKNKDYVFSFGEQKVEILLDKIEQLSKNITDYSSKNTGVDTGDLNFLVANDINTLRSVIEQRVFKGDLTGFGATSKTHISKQLKSGKINKVYDPEKVVKFVYQKDLYPFGFDKTYFTYLDPDILWRARISDRDNLINNPIYQPVKLFILERRAKNQILSVVTKNNVVPQHGGRFMYIVPNDNLHEEDLYLLAGIINSKALQFLYKNRMLGNKNILVPKIEMIEKNRRQEMSEFSKEIHRLLRDIKVFNNNGDSFESKFFTKSLKIEQSIFDILESNPYWKVKFQDDMLVDYNVNFVTLDTSTRTIIINQSIQLEFYNKIDKNIINRTLDALQSYQGNLLQTPLKISKLSLDEGNKSILKKANIHLEKLMNDINQLVYKIYDLTDDEVLTIIEDE